uniref:Caspase-8 n=1 Tax=Molgula tectiformis TaxID=30286 RepID=Q09HM6_MOLTE|nr:caspase-8 [Molgula tectiformis]
MSRNHIWPKWPNPISCPSSSDYRQIMNTVMKNMRGENLKLSLYLCQDIIPQSIDFKTCLQFVQHLEQSNKLSYINISLLVEILYRINRIDLLKKFNISKIHLEDNYLSMGHTHFTPFRILMFELTDELSQTDFDCLKFQFSDHMKQRQLDETTDVVSLLIKLEELGVVDCDDFRKMIEILELIVNPRPFHKFQRLLQGDDTVYIPERFQQHNIARGAIPFNNDNRLDLSPLKNKKMASEPKNERAFVPQIEPISSGKHNTRVRYNFEHQDSVEFQSTGCPNQSQPKDVNTIDLYPNEIDVRKGGDFQEYIPKPFPEPFHGMHGQKTPSAVMHQSQSLNAMRPNNHMYSEDQACSSSGQYYKAPYNSSFSYPNLEKQHALYQTSYVTEEQATNVTDEMDALTIGNDSGNYKMDSKPYVGICLLINNENFEGNVNMEDYNIKCSMESKGKVEIPNIQLKNRAGSKIDADAIEDIFTGFSFKVHRCNDLKHREMQICIQEFSEMDHSKYDSFVCVILSHGKRNIVYSVDGYKFRISDIQSFFTTTTCSTLQDKPKLVFIQACAGANEMEGKEIQCQQESDIHSDGDDNIKEATPFLADFLLANSTWPGYRSYRSTKTGSWFITALVKNLKMYSCKEDLVSIMTRTNNDVSKNMYVQMPMHTNTLRKKVFFKMTHEYKEKIDRELASINPLTTVAVAEGFAASP